MATYIVTVEFAQTDDRTVVVEAANHQLAEDAAFDWFNQDPDSDRPGEATAQTVAEFESDFGTYEEGMFVRVPA